MRRGSLTVVALLVTVMCTACSSSSRSSSASSSAPAGSAADATTGAATITPASNPSTTGQPTTTPASHPSTTGQTATSATTSPATNPATTKPASAKPVTTNPATSLAPKPAFRADAVGAVTVSGPITSGKAAIVLGAGGFDLSTVGYTEDEYFLSGSASAYTSAAPLTSNGQWTVTPTTPAAYTTRIVVRRPTDPAKFNGNVAVEWLNVSAGFDNSPDWSYAHDELIRSGWVWVGVSAQAVGVVGGGNSLGAALALKAADPVRYGPLVHPGDSYSYDIFSQAGAAIRTQWQPLLGGLQPQHVLALGESQSAFRLSTYVDAVAPIANVFDGYLVHSRGAVGAALSQAPLADVPAPDPTLERTDLGVPVLNVLTETDLLGKGLGYARARQSDTASIRTWEIPGTAHADLYNLGIGDTDNGSGGGDTALFAAMSTPVSSIYGGVITCDSPINAGPHTYVLRSALAALARWVDTGTAPPKMPRIDIDAATGEYAVDANGNVTGGIRTPQLDVPIAKLNGLGQTGTSFCGLFGTTTPFDAATLARLYPSHDAFVTAWNSAVDAAVTSGAILAVDGAQLKTVAAASTIGNPA